MSKGVIVWECVNTYHTTLNLNEFEREGLNYQLKRKLGENGKRRQPDSFLSPTLFSSFSKYMNNNCWTISYVSTKASTLDESKMSVLQKFVFLFLCSVVTCIVCMSGTKGFIKIETLDLNTFSNPTVNPLPHNATF